MPKSKAAAKPKPEEEAWDLIIIGGGCVGLAGAMYAGRLEMKTLVLAESIGGVITTTDVVENYPGFIRLTGQELIDKLKAHALDYPKFVTLKDFSKVAKVERRSENSCFKVTADGKTYLAKTVIFATGSKWRELRVPGHDEFRNKGVSYCALCDGALFKGKVAAVVGGSDSAAKEALVLSRYCRKVYMIYRGEKIRPEPINYERVKADPKIEIINKTNVTKIIGDKFVTAVELDNPYKGSKTLQLDGVFVSIGHLPNSELTIPLGIRLNDKKEIIIDRASRTNVPGAFAAGDVVDTEFKQAITGVGEVVSAVYSAYKYISEKTIVCT
jgi:thioredoxin reductase (NADPH)